jgi:hypothetical protein
MVRKILGALVVGIVSTILGVGAVSAALVVVGSGTYNGQSYSLIYDEAQNLTWLDYSHPAQPWEAQNTWANGLVVTVGGLQYSEWSLPTLTQAQQIYQAGLGLFSNLTTDRYWTGETGGITPPPIEPPGPVDPREKEASEASEVSEATDQPEPSTETQPISTTLPIISSDPLGDIGPEPPQDQNYVYFDFASGNSGEIVVTTNYRGLAIMTGRPVPLPGAVFLLGTGLIVLLAPRGWRLKPPRD